MQVALNPTGTNPGPFDASFGFYTLAMAMVSFVFLLCSIRTNVSFTLTRAKKRPASPVGAAVAVTPWLTLLIAAQFAFVLVFIGATVGFGLATGAYWMLALDRVPMALTLLKATGGAFFFTDMIGWWLFLSIMLATVDLPTVPLFDLSTTIKGVSERKAAKNHLE